MQQQNEWEKQGVNLRSRAWRNTAFSIPWIHVLMRQVIEIHLVASWVPHDVHREDLSLPCNQKKKKIQLVKFFTLNWWLAIQRQNMSALKGNKRKKIMTNDIKKCINLFPNRSTYIHNIHVWLSLCQGSRVVHS